MIARRLLLSSLWAAPLLLGGCSNEDDFVMATCDEVEALADEIVSTVEGAEDPHTGVDAARKLLDARKNDIADKVAKMGKLRGRQLSEAAQKRMAKTLIESVADIGMLRAKYLERTLQDEALDAKLQALGDDFAAMLRP